MKISQHMSSGYFKVVGCRMQESTIWVALMVLGFLADWYW